MFLLTIDDAPSSSARLLLNTLKQIQCKGIFFCQGTHLEAYHDIAVEMIREGHILGSHAYSHKAFSKMSLPEAYAEIDRTEALLNQLYQEAGVGRKYKVFRFPFGDLGFGIGRLRRLLCWPHPKRIMLQQKLQRDGFVSAEEFCHQQHYTLRRLRWPTRLYDRGRDWLWTYDSKDWQWTIASPPDVNTMLGKITRLKPTEHGLEIVLFHDLAHNQELRINALRELAERVSFMN